MNDINQLTEPIIGAAIEGRGACCAGAPGSVLSYIRETGHRVGLLIDFHVPKLVDGIARLVNDRSSV